MKDDNNQAYASEKGMESDPSPQEIVYATGKKPYSAPVLTIQAHLRDITLGATGGAGESLLPTVTKVPGTSPPVGGPESGGGDEGGGIFEKSIFDDGS